MLCSKERHFSGQRYWKGVPFQAGVMGKGYLFWQEIWERAFFSGKVYKRGTFQGRVCERAPISKI